jgi:hypothetical protein
MPTRRDFTKEELINAMNKTRSVKSCARYLNCSYNHLKRWLKFYKDESTGKTLFETHKNQCGKGIPKFLKDGTNTQQISLKDLTEGTFIPTSFHPQKIKQRLLNEAYLKEECYNCGFHERRVLDHKVPLILNFIDGNKMNYKLDNLEMVCYNCYFLFRGDLFTNKQLEGFEDHKPVNNSSFDWEIDEYTRKRFEELGLYQPVPMDDGSEYISRV